MGMCVQKEPRGYDKLD